MSNTSKHLESAPTPRTDGEIVCVEVHGYYEFSRGWFVTADFARTLERENAALKDWNARCKDAFDLKCKANELLYKTGQKEIAALRSANAELNKQYFEKCSEVDKLKDKNKVLRNYLEIAMNGGDFTHQKEFWNTMHKFLREKN
jgi:hypothetical protein